MASVGVGQAAHTKEEQEQSAQAAHDGTVREEAQVEETYPHGSRLAALTLSLMLSTLMVALDTNVIGTAIPTMTTQWNSLNDVGWYGSAYLMTLMALQPLCGRIYTLFNTKLVFLLSLCLFEVGSTVCATAQNSPVFIAGRAVSGCGAAGILSGALTIGGRLVPLVKRPMFMAVIMSMYGVAAIAGPTLGGLFTDSRHLTWRFCFYLNLPCGGLAILLCVFLLESYTMPAKAPLSTLSKLQSIDFVGGLLSIGSAVLLFLPLKWGGIDHAWNSGPVIGCLVGFIVLLAILVVTQSRQGESALISPAVFTQRSVCFASFFTCFLNMAIDTHIYYLPLYFQSVSSQSASASGVRLLPYLGTMILTAGISGTLVTVLKHYVPFMVLGSLIFTIACGLISTLTVGSGPEHWVSYQLLAGIGFGMSFQIPYSALHVVLDTAALPTGNALLVLFQALGGALAVSVAQNILGNQLLRRLGEQFSAQDAARIVAAGPTRISQAVEAAQVDVVVEAYSYALSQMNMLPVAAAGMAFLCSLGMEWRTLGKGEKKGLWEERVLEPS